MTKIDLLTYLLKTYGTDVFSVGDVVQKFGVCIKPMFYRLVRDNLITQVEKGKYRVELDD